MYLPPIFYTVLSTHSKRSVHLSYFHLIILLMSGDECNVWAPNYAHFSRWIPIISSSLSLTLLLGPCQTSLIFLWRVTKFHNSRFNKCMLMTLEILKWEHLIQRYPYSLLPFKQQFVHRTHNRNTYKRLINMPVFHLKKGLKRGSFLGPC